MLKSTHKPPNYKKHKQSISHAKRTKMSQNHQDTNDVNHTNHTSYTNHTQESPQSLKPCFKCLSTLIGINIALALGVHFVLGFGYAISFFVAQVSAFLVVLSSFYAMKNKLKKASLEAKESKESTDRKPHSTQDSTQDDEESKPSPVSRFILGVELSFGLYRVLAYLVLAVGIVVLMDLGLFCVLGYIAGVIVCLCSIVLFQLKGYK